MKPRHLLASILLSVALSLPVVAEDADTTAPEAKSSTRVSHFAGTPLETLVPLIGTWEINGTWADGTAIWSRNEFSLGIGNQFLFARTWSKNEQGEIYERYNAYIGYDRATEEVKSWSFTYDGSVTEVDRYEIETKDGKPSMTSGWGSGAEQIKQTITLTSESTYQWLVWFRNGDDAEWQQIMDGTWERVDESTLNHVTEAGPK